MAEPDRAHAAHSTPSQDATTDRQKMIWRIVWLTILLLMLAAGAYGYVRFKEYGKQKAQVLIAEAQQQEGRLELTAALATYREAIALKSVAPKGAAEAAYRAANLYTSKSSHSEAQELLRQAEQLDDSRAEYPIALGRSLLLTRSIDEAAAAFDRASATASDPAMRDQGGTVAAQVSVGQARVALARQDRSGAATLAERAVEQDGSSVEGQLLHAILTIHEEPKRSRELLDEVAGSDNKGFAATAKTLVEIAEQIDNNIGNAPFERALVGSSLIEHNELDLALLELRDATERDDKYRDGWVARAQAEVLLNKLDEAQASIDNALAIDPTFGFSRYVVGQIAQKRGNLSEARTAYERALEQRYQEPQVYVALAGVLDAQGNKEGALDVLHVAIDLEIQSHDLYDAIYWLHVDRTEFDEALDTAQKYTAFDERGTTAQGLLAYAYLLTGDEQLARKTADTLLARDPLSAIASLVLGILDEDRVFLEKARDLDMGGRVADYANEALGKL